MDEAGVNSHERAKPKLVRMRTGVRGDPLPAGAPPKKAPWVTKSVWMQHDAPIAEYIPKALDTFDIRVVGTLPKETFVEISCHGELVGGWEDGVVWALNERICDSVLGEGAYPRMKVFTKSGREMERHRGHLCPWRMRVTKAFALRLSEHGGRLAPWSSLNFVSVPMPMLPAKPNGVLEVASEDNKAHDFETKPEKQSAMPERVSRRKKQKVERFQPFDSEPQPVTLAEQLDSTPQIATTKRTRRDQHDSYLEAMMQHSTDEEDTTEDSSLGSTRSSSQSTQRAKRTPDKASRSRAKSSTAATSNSIDMGLPSDTAPDEATHLESVSTTDSSYRVRLTFSGSEKFMHAQKKIELTGDTEVMELIVAAIEFCRFEALPIRPPGSFIEVAHESTLLGGMDADGRVWALTQPLHELALPATLATTNTSVYSTRGTRLKANFYGTGWYEMGPTKCCLSALQAPPTNKRVRKSEPAPATTTAPTGQKPKSPERQMSHAEVAHAQTSPKHEILANQDADMAAEAPPAKIKRQRSTAKAPKVKTAAETLPVQEPLQPSESVEQPSPSQPHTAATCTLDPTSIIHSADHADLLGVLRDSYGSLSDKYLKLQEDHQRLLHEHARLRAWKVIADQPCIVCGLSIDSPENATVNVPCGHTVMHSGCVSDNAELRPHHCSVCDQLTLTIMPLAIVP